MAATEPQHHLVPVAASDAQQHQQQQQHEDDDDVELASEYDAFPHSEECTAVLTMKAGEPLMAVRKKLHDEITITFIPEEGFGVFQSKVERHYSKIGPTFVQEKRGIYLKPSSNATQTKYVLLTKENFDPLLRMRWKIARSMKVELKYEVFCYFVDTTNKKEKKRLSMKMFQQHPEGGGHALHHHAELNGAPAPVAPAAFMGYAPSGSSGVSNHGYPLVSAQSISQAIQNYADINASIIDASLPSSAATSAGKKPKSSLSGSLANGGRDDSTGDRPRKIARLSSRNAATTGGAAAGEQLVGDLHEEPFFQPIPFRINGFVVPLEVDITALRRALGLSLASQPLSSSSSSSSNSAMADPSAPASAAETDAQQLQQQYDR